MSFIPFVDSILNPCLLIHQGKSSSSLSIDQTFSSSSLNNTTLYLPELIGDSDLVTNSQVDSSRDSFMASLLEQKKDDDDDCIERDFDMAFTLLPRKKRT